MIPYPHQVDGAEEVYDILKKHGLAYMAWEERCGKTLASILVAEMSKATKVLVITKKKALDGWYDTLRQYKHNKDYTVTNYHQAKKLKPVYDLVLLDESHSYVSGYPKPSKMWKEVAALTRGIPIIYMSATPYAQGYQLLYNQFKLSTWTPFKFKSFYEFHRAWGIPDKIRTPFGLQETYKKIKPEVYKTISHLFSTRTRKELNFEHEPEDHLHMIELSKQTRDLYNKCMKDEMLLIPEKGIESPLDSPMKIRTTLHMVEGGVAKVDDSYYVLDNTEKIDAIVKDFGDTKDMVIMYQYIAEGEKLRKAFKHATILQGTSFAEGVDLSMYKHLIIYSMDFSTSRYSQRRARQANKKRDTPIDVHFYLVDGAVSEQVYKTVAINKENFINSLFIRSEI